jgi:hypothetical protein
MRCHYNVTGWQLVSQTLRRDHQKPPSEIVKVVTAYATRRADSMIETPKNTPGPARPALTQTHDRHLVPPVDQLIRVRHHNAHTARQASPRKNERNTESR